jgi:hypothetical protein
MVHFRERADALEGTVEMVARSPETGLPAHAGIASGPAVFQDGDYFTKRSATFRETARSSCKGSPRRSCFTTRAGWTGQNAHTAPPALRDLN